MARIPESSILATSYHKFGRTHSDPTPHQYEFLFDGLTGADILPDRIRLHLVDNQRGDDDLLANGPKCEPSIIFPVTYGYIDITSLAGTPTQYVVNLVQMLDPEGGIQCWIEYTLDASFDLVDGPIFVI